ncbi:hypothetical protein LXL04_029716 [Taraxacum kok-saghyz]
MVSFKTDFILFGVIPIAYRCVSWCVFFLGSGRSYIGSGCYGYFVFVVFSLGGYSQDARITKSFGAPKLEDDSPAPPSLITVSLGARKLEDVSSVPIGIIDSPLDHFAPTESSVCYTELEPCLPLWTILPSQLHASYRLLLPGIGSLTILPLKKRNQFAA